MTWVSRKGDTQALDNVPSTLDELGFALTAD